MQTFLPYSSFSESAKVLDNKRLGKQRVEAYQILKTLLKGPITNGKKTPWYNHPAVQMWKGYELALSVYGLECCRVWISRGYKDTLFDKILKLATITDQASYPTWIGNNQFHASHRSNLLRKNKEYYRRFGWTEPNNLPYYWPTKEK